MAAARPQWILSSPTSAAACRSVYLKIAATGSPDLALLPAGPTFGELALGHGSRHRATRCCALRGVVRLGDPALTRAATPRGSRGGPPTGAQALTAPVTETWSRPAALAR